MSTLTLARRLWLIELACVTGLLLLAASLRLYRLSDFPAGYHNDEVTDAHIIETVVEGRRAIFFPEDTGSEPFYMYWSAPFVAGLGHTVLALRLPSVFLAMLALCTVWALARRLFGRLTAGVTLAALSVSWWGLLIGRITLHVAPVAPCLALAMYWLVRWLQSDDNLTSAILHTPRSTVYPALAGLFFALAINSYTAARVAPILIIALLLYLALIRRETLRTRWRGWVILCAVTAVLAAPLALYLLTHPDAKQLSYSGFAVDQPITDLLAGKPQLVLETTRDTLGMFGFTADPLPYYDLPGRSLLEPIGAVLFWVGVALAAWRWRDPPYGFVLIGLIVTLLPGIFSQPAPNYARTIGAMVFAFLPIGITVDAMWQRARIRWGEGAWRAAAAALTAVLTINLAWTARDFFIVWPAQPDVRWWMQTGLKEVADALNVQAVGGAQPVAICVESHLIDERAEWWRPAWWIYHYLSPRTEADARWYDCAESAVIPAGDSPRFAFPNVTSLDQLGAFPIARWMNVRQVRASQAAGQSLIVTAQPMPIWSAEVNRLAQASPVAWPPEANRIQPPGLPLNWRALEITAYEIDEGGRAAPGDVITVTTYWRVTAPLEPRLALFTHILTGTRVIAQDDHLAVTSQSLQPGDVFAQVHIIRLPSDVERGVYDIAVGLYSQDAGTRLMIYDGGQPVADRIMLNPLRVRRQP
jgi:4-amino-4-deoxy-L-arabinose transferase-like glycosyltransferase